MYAIMQHESRAPMPMQMTITSFWPHVVPNGGVGVVASRPATAIGNGVVDCISVLEARVEVSLDPEVLESKLENAMPTNVGSLVNSAVILMPVRSWKRAIRFERNVSLVRRSKSPSGSRPGGTMIANSVSISTFPARRSERNSVQLALSLPSQIVRKMTLRGSSSRTKATDCRKLSLNPMN